MQRLAGPNSGVGKEPVWPSNARLADKTALRESSQWRPKEYRDVSVSLGMGLPTSGDLEELGPLRDKVRVGMGEGDRMW